MQHLSLLVAIILSSVALVHATSIAPPPAGKLYHGFYFGGVGTDSHDPTEHDFSAQDIEQYEKTIGAKTAWVYFSDNWFESRKFPEGICASIRQLGKIPFLRLMLRSDVDQNHAERVFSVDKIIAGEFDADLRGWARGAKDFRTPLLMEWGTEPNGKWFSWNGHWNGGARIGPAKYVTAYRHIVDLMRNEGANNVQWVWHVNWDDDPEQEWNGFENYFPGPNYCDWVALSVYGPTTPRTRDDTEGFAVKLHEAYPRLVKIVPDKPIIIAEFGCDLHNKHCDAAEWARGALDEIFSGKWPALVGFCWWNEGWQNDDHKKNDTDMIIWHDPNLTRVFREEVARHLDKIQEVALADKADGN
jgi:hypothetical protein